MKAPDKTPRAAKLGRPKTGRNGKGLNLYISKESRSRAGKLAQRTKPKGVSISALFESLVNAEWDRHLAQKAGHS